MMEKMSSWLSSPATGAGAHIYRHQHQLCYICRCSYYDERQRQELRDDNERDYGSSLFEDKEEEEEPISIMCV